MQLTDAKAMEFAFEIMTRTMPFLAKNRASMTDQDLIVKPDGSPVTTRDLAGQALYVLPMEKGLNLSPGELRLCGEETSEMLEGPDGSMIRKRICALLADEGFSISESEIASLISRGSLRPEPESGSTHWICDPIDGTKRYLSGHVYSTCLAYVRNGTLVAGAIGVPDLPSLESEGGVQPGSTGTLVGAYLGGGAFQVAGVGNSPRTLTPLTVRPDPVNPDEVRVARSLGSIPFGPRLQLSLEAAGVQGIPVQVDNQSKYAALVTDRVDLIAQPGFPADSPCSWDYAPGVLIAEEFGVVVKDGANRSFDFDTGSHLLCNHGVRCAHPSLYEPLFLTAESS